jgi:hypothetical protein
MEKTEVQGIYKVSEGVLINKDNDALSKYKKRRDLLKSKDEKIDNLEMKVSELSSQIESIKNLLEKMVK